MKRWMPFVMIGVMLLVMVGFMGMFSLMLGEINPLAMMLPGNLGSEWGCGAPCSFHS